MKTGSKVGAAHSKSVLNSTSKVFSQIDWGLLQRKTEKFFAKKRKNIDNIINCIIMIPREGVFSPKSRVFGQID